MQWVSPNKTKRVCAVKLLPLFRKGEQCGWQILQTHPQQRPSTKHTKAVGKDPEALDQPCETLNYGGVVEL